jgi:hypothetical protein
LGNGVRLSCPAKFFLLWQIIILLLPAPFIPTLVSSSGIIRQSDSGRKTARHPCGCPLEETGCHACRCVNCQGSCCAGNRQQASPACHQADKKPAGPGIRVAPCGGPEELNVNSCGKVKFILADFLFLPGIPSIPAVLDVREKLENLFRPPMVPPPEINRSA